MEEDRSGWGERRGGGSRVGERREGEEEREEKSHWTTEAPISSQYPFQRSHDLLVLLMLRRDH